MDHLNKKILEDIESRMGVIEGSLVGLGGLFENVSNNMDFCLDPDERFGISQLLKLMSSETSRVSDILRCSYDSQAQKEVYSKDDDSGEEVLPEVENGCKEELTDQHINSILNLLRDTLKNILKRDQVRLQASQLGMKTRR